MRPIFYTSPKNFLYNAISKNTDKEERFVLRVG